ncbi:mitochondrial carrier [Viridothelium virens]|uniref:Mitochondrial carrier n=1 Tax=Viridothelium virens TaxID=1048519 RepID=A0A6A6HIT2_VIRVR|nr:mitochondrial carrier [Viridothelium virens]
MNVSEETVVVPVQTGTTIETTKPRPVAHQTTEAFKDIAFGSAAGIVGKFVEYPFDTVKVRLQSQPEHLPLQYTGPLDCFKQAIRRDGFLGLYRGISAPLAGAAIENSSLFLSYRLAQDFLQATLLPANEPLPLSALVTCGGVSGAVTSLVLTPIELIKCKMQVPPDGTTQYNRPGPLTLIASIYRREGLMGFWHGQLGTLIREAGGSAAWFGSYEGVSLFFRQIRDGKNAIRDEALPVYQQMLAGAAAGMSYNFLFYPADTIKSRMQTEESGQLTGGKRKFATVGKALWREQGLKGLYRGCGITVGRSAPSSALIFTVYESLRRGGFRPYAEDNHGISCNHSLASFLFMTSRSLSVEKVILDPRYKDLLALLKGLRNGAVYGTKVRFPHALVMVFLFRTGTLREKARIIFKATRQHARNLALFALTYKSSLLALKYVRPERKEAQYDTFLAGLIGGYTIFGRGIQSSVNQQIVIYIFARVVLALAKLSIAPRDPAVPGGGGLGLIRDEDGVISKRAWPIFASLSWASVMYLFRYHPDTLQPSLRSSMKYIYENADHWDCVRNFIWHNK